MKRTLGRWLGTFGLWAAATALIAWSTRDLHASSEPLSFALRGHRIQLLAPHALGLLLVLPTLIWGTRTSLADLPRAQRWLGTFARAAFLAVLSLALARPALTHTVSRFATAFVFDVSDSVAPESIERARAFVAAALKQNAADDHVRIVAFAREPHLIASKSGQVPSVDDLLPAPPEPSDPPAANQGAGAGSATAIEAALRYAYALLPNDYYRRIVLFSDGVETEGNYVTESFRVHAGGAVVHVVPYVAAAPAEVAVTALDMPSRVEIGQTFRVRGHLYATRDAHVRARLYQDDALNGLGGVRELELHAGENEVTFDSVVRVGGELTYKLELEALSADHFLANNRFERKLDVPSRPLVLVVDPEPSRMSYVAGALRAQQFDVDIRAPSAFPTTLRELEPYAFVILSDMPARDFDATAQQLLERYVSEHGGGLLVAGGTKSYGPGGWDGTTLERLLPVSVDAEKHQEMPSVAMALVIDRSGSMEGLALEMAKTACAATVATLKPTDLVEVVAFDDTPSRYVSLQPARYRSRIEDDILRIRPGGGTSIFPALDAAYQDIATARARRKHVILLTDGQASHGGIEELVQAMIADSITVTTVGLGPGVDGYLLRMIAETGGGRFHQVSDPNNLPRLFTHETELISRQPTVQDWFPAVQTANARFMKGVAIASAPLLRGYVSTQMKGAPAEQVLATESGEPLLARWRVGMGHVIAWTSDLKSHWAVDWLRWPGFGHLLGQLLREHMQSDQKRVLTMHTEVLGQRVRAWVDAYTEQEDFDKTLVSRLTLGDNPNEVIPMPQVAPGRYQAEFLLPGYGSFTLRAQHQRLLDDGSEMPEATSTGQVSVPYPLEYARVTPDLTRLKEAASAGGGQLDPSPSALRQPDERRLLSRTPLWQYCLGAALLLFFLDLLLRRVRLWDRTFRHA